MRLATSIQLLAVASCFGCGSPEKEAYARLAREANPIFTAMKPTATRLLAVAPSQEQLSTLSLSRADAEAIVNACESADEQLWSVRKIDFDREPIAPNHGDASVAEYAGWLLDHRQIECQHNAPSLITVCAFWCYDNWKRLIEEVERLRREAQKYGVGIVSLRE